MKAQELRDTAREPTTAEHIAARFGDDQQRFRNDAGEHLDNVVLEEGAIVLIVDRARDIVRYEFRDGSAIVTTTDAWSIGFPSTACACWAVRDVAASTEISERHEPYCPENDKLLWGRHGDFTFAHTTMHVAIVRQRAKDIYGPNAFVNIYSTGVRIGRTEAGRRTETPTFSAQVYLPADRIVHLTPRRGS